MNRFFLIFIVYVVIVFSALIVWQQTNFGATGVYYGSAESQKIAEEWILDNSPTYRFDGFDLKIADSETGRCFSCFEFTFSFQSRQAGYGNREGQILAQVITSHTMVVAVRQVQVIKVVTDQKYDEMKREFLSPETNNRYQ